MFADVAHMSQRLRIVEQPIKRTWTFSRIEDGISGYARDTDGDRC